MTPEEINIAIAQHNGWEIKNGSVVTLCTGESLIAPLWFNDEQAPDGWDNPPDYCNDLNAMQEVLLRPGFDWKRFVRELWDTVPDGSIPLFGEHETMLLEYWLFAIASARQLAEAYVRTIGKWKE